MARATKNYRRAYYKHEGAFRSCMANALYNLVCIDTNDSAKIGHISAHTNISSNFWQQISIICSDYNTVPHDIVNNIINVKYTHNPRTPDFTKFVKSHPTCRYATSTLNDIVQRNRHDYSRLLRFYCESGMT